jgi:hypothetical protein
MGKIRLVYVLFGISPRIWNGLRTYTEVPLYIVMFNTRLSVSVFPTSVSRDRIVRLCSDWLAVHLGACNENI